MQINAVAADLLGYEPTCREVESDVDEPQDDEGEGHEDGGRNAEDEPSVVAFSDAL